MLQNFYLTLKIDVNKQRINLLLKNYVLVFCFQKGRKFEEIRFFLFTLVWIKSIRHAGLWLRYDLPTAQNFGLDMIFPPRKTALKSNSFQKSLKKFINKLSSSNVTEKDSNLSHRLIF